MCVCVAATWHLVIDHWALPPNAIVAESKEALTTEYHECARARETDAPPESENMGSMGGVSGEHAQTSWGSVRE